MSSSEHTRLINKFIGLCKKTVKWPAILADLGYEVQLIEQNINLKSAQKVKPDVIAVKSNQIHAIVADCKTGNNIEKEQELRYLALESDDLKYYITAYDKKRIAHSVCYVDHDTNHENLKDHTSIPFLTFSQDSLKLNGKFNRKELDSVLAHKISLNGMYEPVSFYPFSPDDENYQLVPHVLRGLISFLVKKGHKIRQEIGAKDTALEICKIIHPYYNAIETHHRKLLVKRIQEMIKLIINSNEELKEQIAKIEKREFNSGTLKRLAKLCEDITNEYESQKKMTDFS